MITVAKWTVILFGIYILFAGLLMLFAPKRARATLQKAGSTNLINYAEITLRMIPAVALLIYAEYSRFPVILTVFGWFMLGTSFILYFVPRRIHHNYSLKCAEILKPEYFRLLSPLAMLFGYAILHSVWI